MQLGLMNHPARPVADEIRRVAAAGFDFVDLTLEPPRAWPVDAAEVSAALGDRGLSVVGHTSPHLPIASPFEGLREQAREVLRRCFDVFAKVGASKVNVHPERLPAVVPPDEAIRRNAEAIAQLADDAAAAGVTLMVENMGRTFNTAAELQPLFDAAPEARLHLDVGHANMGRPAGEPNRVAELLDAFADRVAHVHVHDNLGLDDLHLPLGAGTVDWPDVVRRLRAAAYDGTVTIEVFATQRAQVDVSARLWREWWSAA